MMIVAPAIFLASGCLTRGWRPWDKTALAALWLGLLWRAHRIGDIHSARRHHHDRPLYRHLTSSRD